MRPVRVLQLAEKIADYFGASFDPQTTLPENYNTAPTNDVYGVVAGPDGKPTLQVFHWGLVPIWAKDIKIGSKMINARVRDARREAGVQVGVQEATHHHPDGRLLRVGAGERGCRADQGRQAEQATDVHPSPRWRAAGRRRAVDDVARQDSRARRAVAAQLHGGHDLGQRDDGAGARPHAGDAAGRRRGTNGSIPTTTTSRSCSACWYLHPTTC